MFNISILFIHSYDGRLGWCHNSATVNTRSERGSVVIVSVRWHWFPGVLRVNHMVTVSPGFLRIIWFLQQSHYVTLPSTAHKGSFTQPPHCQHLFALFIIIILIGMKWSISRVLGCTPPMAYYVVEFFSCVYGPFVLKD